MSAPCIGVVILTHGAAGQHMLQTTKELLGEEAVSRIHVIQVRKKTNRDRVTEELRNQINDLAGPKGVLLMCDLVGSTPANCCRERISMDTETPIAILTGINLPMLIKVASCNRHSDELDQLATAALLTAAKSLSLIDGDS